MKESCIEPIEWPTWWPASGRHFLQGMPFIGPHVRILRRARVVLTGRNPNEIQPLWDQSHLQYPLVTSKKEALFEIIDRYISWPNHFFIPCDRAPIVLGCIPGIWIDSTDVLDDICRCLGIKPSAAVYETAFKGTLVEFLECLETSVRNNLSSVSFNCPKSQLQGTDSSRHPPDP